MFDDEAIQLRDPGERVADPLPREHGTLGIQGAEIVVGLSPVHSDREHCNHLQSIELQLKPEATVAT
jgi:hypothetical protein